MNQTHFPQVSSRNRKIGVTHLASKNPTGTDSSNIFMKTHHKGINPQQLFQQIVGNSELLVHNEQGFKGRHFQPRAG